MNKKFNSFLFYLVALLFNIVMFFVSFILIFYAAMSIATWIYPEASQTISPFIAFGSMILGIAASAFIYFKVVKLFAKKVDMGKYFHPISIPQRIIKKP